MHFPGLRAAGKRLSFSPMKFALAILVFALFAFFISWGVLMMLHGQPWLLVCAMLIFLGTFAKYGCLTQ